MMNTTLLIMAAGIGSRFGTGIKQLEPVDDANHIIMDYSIHDAIEAGFNHVVFIIRKDIKEAFHDAIGKRIEGICNRLNVEFAYAYQELDDLPEEIKKRLTKLERAENYLKKQSDYYMDLSLSAKKKRTYDRSNPAYKWVALAVVILGIGAFLYGIYSLLTHAGFGMYFLLFGLAAIFLFAGANVLPTSKNNKKYIENQLERSIQQMEAYIQKYPDFPVPAHYAHPVVLKRMQDIMKDGRAQTIPEALTVLKDDLKALNSNVTVEKEEYDEIVTIKPMFLVMDYK